MLLSREKLQLCDIQGRLFELALKNGCDCPKFIEAFMNSKTASFLDDIYDRMQWAGEEYILEELNDEVNGLKKQALPLTPRSCTGSATHTGTGITIQEKAADRFTEQQTGK